MIGPRALVPSAVAVLLLVTACETPPPSDPVGEATPSYPAKSDATYPDNRPNRDDRRYDGRIYSDNRPYYAPTTTPYYAPTTVPYYAPASTIAGPAVVGPSTVTIRFAGTVGDQMFRCGASYGGVGVTGSTVVPSDFRFYVSNVALIDESGRAVPMALVEDGQWQSRNVALLDFEDGNGPCLGGTPGVRDSITGNIPPGRYHGLVFTLGVPADQNVSPAGMALAPLNVPALAMAPTGGFHFLKVDMATSGQPISSYPVIYPAPSYAVPGYVAPGYASPAYGYPTATYPAAGFPVHVAAGVMITFQNFDFGRDVVVADLRGLLASTNVDVNTPGTPAGCQAVPGDPDCAGIFSRLGIGAPAMQSFFRQGSAPLVSSLTR